jgi:hypothetical protein
MKETEFQAVHVFKALGNPLRLKILRALAQGSATPGALASLFHKTYANISQHPSAADPYPRRRGVRRASGSRVARSAEGWAGSRRRFPARGHFAG